MGLILNLALFVVVILLVLLSARRTRKRFTQSTATQINELNQKNQSLLDLMSRIEARAAKPFQEFAREGELRDWIIVPTYNRLPMLTVLLSDIRKHEPSAAVLVVDSGSNDGTAEFLARALVGGQIQKALFNRQADVPQWRKAFALQQAFRLLALEPVRSLTWIDDDMQLQRPWILLSLSLLDALQGEQVRLVNLLVDEVQNHNHPVLETRQIEGETVYLKASFNGTFVCFRPALLAEAGLPPVGEGISIASVEDWYYSRIFKARGWKVAALNASKHLGYGQSHREAEEQRAMRPVL
ncbi:MAG: glycosyltransferase family A protein [Fibrobacterota bacterium]